MQIFYMHVCVCVCVVLCNFITFVSICNHHHIQDPEQSDHEAGFPGSSLNGLTNLLNSHQNSEKEQTLFAAGISMS